MVPEATTDELLDVVDLDTGLPIEQRSRRDVHRLGLWHRVFHCLVVRPVAGSVVLQRRSPAKKAFPGQLDLSATGHLAAGETPSDGIRELHEELGVDVDPADLVALGTRLLADDRGEGRNREIVHVHLLADDRPLDSYRPAPDEVSGLVEITAGDLLDLLAERAPVRNAVEWSPDTGSRPAMVTRDDLVDGTAEYWVVLAVMAERYLAGERPLAI